jgi:hypothetical protein
MTVTVDRIAPLHLNGYPDEETAILFLARASLAVSRPSSPAAAAEGACTCQPACAAAVRCSDWFDQRLPQGLFKNVPKHLLPEHLRTPLRFSRRTVPASAGPLQSGFGSYR